MTKGELYDQPGWKVWKPVVTYFLAEGITMTALNSLEWIIAVGASKPSHYSYDKDGYAWLEWTVEAVPHKKLVARLAKNGNWRRTVVDRSKEPL